MSERSKWELYLGIAAIVMGVLYGGLAQYYFVEFGRHSEYFNGWWVPVGEVVLGVFLLVRYRSDRIRRLSDTVEESRYYKAFWVLVSLALAAFGGWLMYLVGRDFASEGALGVFGFGTFMLVAGLVTAGLSLRRLRYS